MDVDANENHGPSGWDEGASDCGKGPSNCAQEQSAHVVEQRPTLLVSVRDQHEAAIALASQVAIVDLKEPRRGALAAVDPHVWRDVLELHNRHQSRARLSVALGEADESLQLVGQLPAGFSFAKAGPRGCQTATAVIGLWQQLRRQLPAGTQLVAVAYADYQLANTLAPEQILQLAADHGLQHCLIDTLGKNGSSLVDHVTPERLTQLAALARQRNLWWALAGSLRVEQLDLLAAVERCPNCFGVRGDVCRGDRRSQLSPTRIKVWQQILQKRCELPLRQTGQAG